MSKRRQEFAYEREVIAERERRRSTLTAIRDVRVSSAARIKFLEHIACAWLVDIEVDARRLPALFAFAKCSRVASIAVSERRRDFVFVRESAAEQLCTPLNTAILDVWRSSALF